MRLPKKIFRYARLHKKLVIFALMVLGLVFFIFRPKPPAPPTTQIVKKANLVQSVSVSGTVVATREAKLVFGASANVVYLGAKKGDHVNKWQTIAILDERAVEQNIQNAALALSSQKVSYDIVNDFNGDRAITDTGLSVSAYRQLLTALNSVGQAQTQLVIQQLTKTESEIYAPFDGILTRADISAVGTSAIAATTAFTVTDPTSVVFDMDIDEADIGKIRQGQKVNFNLDAYQNEDLTEPVNSIDFVSHTTSNGANSFTVEAILPENSKYKYRVGMNGNAEIITGEKDNVLTIPLTSIVNDNIVYTKVDKKYEKRKVTLGFQNDTDAEVISGLNAGDIIVTEPSKIKI